MKRIHFATTNNGKFNTTSKTLAKYGIQLVQVPLELPESQSDEIRVIAREKAIYAFEKIGKPCMVQDAGLYIPSLNGFPKAFVKFALSTIGIDGILKLLEGSKRDCEFRHCIAYIDGKHVEPLYFETKVRGAMIKSRKGKMQKHNWSELSLIFVPRRQKKTLAQMSRKEYDTWKAQSDVEEGEKALAKFLNGKIGK